MILSNPGKSFLIALVILTFSTGCRFWQNITNTNSSPGPGVFTEDRSDLPFSTREPEVYQARIVTTAGGTERSAFIARNGAKRRSDINYGEKYAVIWILADKEYLLLPYKKVYAEEAGSPGETALPSELESLTVGWLNVNTPAEFESAGAENGIKKYRSRLSGSDASEVVLSIDEASGSPVKQEFYSMEGGDRILVYTVELRDLRLEAEDKIFEIPAGYRKISIQDLRKLMSNG
jgi:hypothetical protein